MASTLASGMSALLASSTRPARVALGLCETANVLSNITTSARRKADFMVTVRGRNGSTLRNTRRAAPVVPRRARKFHVPIFKKQKLYHRGAQRSTEVTRDRKERG